MFASINNGQNPTHLAPNKIHSRLKRRVAKALTTTALIPILVEAPILFTPFNRLGLPQTPPVSSSIMTTLIRGRTPSTPPMPPCTA